MLKKEFPKVKIRGGKVKSINKGSNNFMHSSYLPVEIPGLTLNIPAPKNKLVKISCILGRDTPTKVIVSVNNDYTDVELKEVTTHIQNGRSISGLGFELELEVTDVPQSVKVLAGRGMYSENRYLVVEEL